MDYGQNLLNGRRRERLDGADAGDGPCSSRAPRTYTAGKISYNFKTKKGKIADAVTQQGEGFVHAEVVKKNAT